MFVDSDNYQRFHNLYDKHIEPVAVTYAGCLMIPQLRDRLLVRIKEEREINHYWTKNADRSFRHCQVEEKIINLSACIAPDSVNNTKDLKKVNPTKQFSHLFNAYSKYFNFKYQRTGALFERPFERIEVSNEHYFRQLVLYIHYIPKKHGFVENFKHYPWSSYGTMLLLKPAKAERKKVLGWFNDSGNFEYSHAVYNEPFDLKDLFLEN